MASHLTIIDSALKRAVIKTTPATNLSNVLEEACKKLGYKPENFVLKHNDKPVDISRSIRLSGLPNGAKLNLVQGSRSPTVVSIALQLPARGESPSIRLQDKFSSDTPVWQILRRFESGAAGSQSSSVNHNFTQQGTAQILDRAVSGSGRLFYAMPIVNLMGRELGTFVDLQKTLGQLGFNGGSCLLRLSFRNTEQPLEDAMMEISKYFQELESPASGPSSTLEGRLEDGPSVPHADGAVTTMKTMTGSDKMVNMASDQPLDLGAVSTEVENQALIAPTPPVEQSERAQWNTQTSKLQQSGLTIFAPPSTSTPAAATNVPYNEEDYHPTIAHAQQHQARLNHESQNRRLQSDREIEQDQQALKEKLEAITAVTVRFRFPDNSSVNQTFSRDAAASDLYSLCHEMLDRPNEEAFSIKYPGSKGSLELLIENDKKLVMDLAWQSRVVVTVVWAENVLHKGPSLKQRYLLQAQELKVQLPNTSQEGEASSSGGQQASSKNEQPKKSRGSGDIEKKLKDFLRLGKK